MANLILILRLIPANAYTLISPRTAPRAIIPPMLPYVPYFLLLLISLSAVVLTILSLPGIWLMFATAAALYAWQARPSLAILAFMLLVLLIGEGVELLGS